MKIYNPDEEPRARILSVTPEEFEALRAIFLRIEEVDDDLYAFAVEDEVVMRVRVERTN